MYARAFFDIAEEYIPFFILIEYAKEEKRSVRMAGVVYIKYHSWVTILTMLLKVIFVMRFTLVGSVFQNSPLFAPECEN